MVPLVDRRELDDVVARVDVVDEVEGVVDQQLSVRAPQELAHQQVAYGLPLNDYSVSL